MMIAGSSSAIAASSMAYASAGLDGSPTRSPGMWQSSASTHRECWADDDVSEPCCVRTVSGAVIRPSVSQRTLAARFTSWSMPDEQEVRPHDLDDRAAADQAAPSAAPSIAFSEIGVSNTRSPNSSASPRVTPNTPPGPATSSPNTSVSGCVAHRPLQRGVERIAGT